MTSRVIFVFFTISFDCFPGELNSFVRKGPVWAHMSKSELPNYEAYNTLSETSASVYPVPSFRSVSRPSLYSLDSTTSAPTLNGTTNQTLLYSTVDLNGNSSIIFYGALLSCAWFIVICAVIVCKARREGWCLNRNRPQLALPVLIPSELAQTDYIPQADVEFVPLPASVSTRTVSNGQGSGSWAGAERISSAAMASQPFRSRNDPIPARAAEEGTSTTMAFIRLFERRVKTTRAVTINDDDDSNTDAIGVASVAAATVSSTSDP